MKDRYQYIGVVSFEKDGITIEFPDFDNIATSATTQNEIIDTAKEFLSLHIWGMEHDNKIIPDSSSIKDIELNSGQLAILVDIFMVSVRDKLNNQIVKKTLTIPKWLNDEAQREHVNFSFVLQEALKEYLKIN